LRAVSDSTNTALEERLVIAQMAGDLYDR